MHTPTHTPKSILLLLLLTTLNACSSTNTQSSNNSDPTKSPQYATRHALYAIYSNNPKLLRKTTWPAQNSHYALTGQNLTQQQLIALEKEINNLDLSPLKLPYNLQTTKQRKRLLSKPVHFKINFRNNPLPLTLMYKNNQWKLDIRWYIASNTPDHELSQQQNLCRNFIKAFIFKNMKRLKSYSLPNSNIKILANGKSPAPDQIDAISTACETMPLVQLTSGSLYQTISKEWKSAHNQTNKRITLVGLLNGKPIPFQLYKTNPNTPWLIDPSPWIYAANSTQ